MITVRVKPTCLPLDLVAGYKIVCLGTIWCDLCLTDLTDLTDYSLLPNGLVFVQNSYSSFLRTVTKYNLVMWSKINKKQFRIGEYWNITFICTRHAKIR